MKIAANQAYFMPYIGYFQLIESADKILLYENVSFRKRSWMTRNQLMDKKNGTTFFINIPVRNKSSFYLIKDIMLTEEFTPWKNKFLKMVLHNYSKATFFDDTFTFLNEMLKDCPTDTLHNFNSYCISEICKYLSIGTVIQSQNNNYEIIESKLTNHYDSNYLLNADKKTRRIIEMCKYENASCYINLPGGQDLYDPSFFNAQGIELNFTEMPKYEYSQFGHEFKPHLSIIDVLMHVGVKGASEIIKSYSLLKTNIVATSNPI